MPSLSCSNRFSFLPVDNINEIKVVQPPEDPPTPPVSAVSRHFRPRWERDLLARLVIASLEDPSPPRSLKIKVDIETTDTGEVKSLDALIDSGATGRFVDRDYVKANRLRTRVLSRPIPVYNVDGNPNEAGSISEVADLILKYQSHSERALFAVTGLGKQNLILGLPWLQKHNPEIDWTTGTVKMNRCSPSRCSGCREERKAKQAETRHIARCTAGPLPASVEDAEEEEPEAADAMELADKDRMFAAGLFSPPQEVRATATMSQRLAEAHLRNTNPPPDSSAPALPAEDIPHHLREFASVFSKESFDVLPESRPWDHAIELIPDAKAASCKVYPLSPVEQKEMDAFLRGNLESGRIRSSKSPMASPVFFIKKKDGSLRLVQDYRALNAITVKNRYPLPLISELVNKLRGAKYFTKLDVRWGFNKVRMKPGDEWKAAFRTNRGLFEPLVMFFGLTNSPATFQTMMNDIFQDLISEGVVVVYMDDILIFTETLEQHREVTRKVLEILRDYKLFLKPAKCEFERTRVEYLGLIISARHG
jgi:hypothetical protein